MVLGSIIPGFCMLGIAVADTVGPGSPPAQVAIVVFVVLFGFFHSGFCLGLSFSLTSELASSRLRVQTMGLANIVSGLMNCK